MELKQWYAGLLIGLLTLIHGVGAQTNPMLNKRWNTMNINKVATTFNNVGMLCDGNNQNFNLAKIPSFEYPQGSGRQYGTCVAVVVGAPADQDPAAVGGVNPENLPYLDGTMDEGPADFWNEEHFAPYPEFVTAKAIISTDPSTWPDPWPEYLPNYYIDNVWDNNRVENNALPLVPILRDSVTGWPGFGPNGKQLADQETFAVMYGWGGTDQLTENSQTRWLRTQLIMRGMAWQGSLYEDFIVWVFIIRNVSPAPIHDLRMGIHVDLGFLPEFIPGIDYDADRHYYDPSLQLAYGWDDDGFEENPLGGFLTADQIAWGGVVVLEMPGNPSTVATYDATHFWKGQTTNAGSGGQPEMYYTWNLLNLNDPEDSDGDGIDDDFDHNGVPDAQEGGPGYYLGDGADGLQILGSHAFDLAPGEMDTLIFATVFGTSREDLFTNAKRAITLYQNDWKVVTAPPAPTVEAFATDRKVVLVWNTVSEQAPDFEGYKIYRSLDHGQTWGTESFTDFSGGIHYVPLAQYDLVDGVKGNYKTLPEYAWFNLGNDQWVPIRSVVEGDTIKGLSIPGLTLHNFQDGDSVNVFIDQNVINGLEYWYYVAAYDSGNAIVGPLENTPATQPEEVNNTVKITPQLPVATQSLGRVRVVPNPYFVSEIWEQGLGDHMIQFTGLPRKATIRIFNAAGELIRVIEHNEDSSIARWDLKNRFNQLIAPGVYYYHVKSELGEVTGKFIVVL